MLNSQLFLILNLFIVWKRFELILEIKWLSKWSNVQTELSILKYLTLRSFVLAKLAILDLQAWLSKAQKWYRQFFLQKERPTIFYNYNGSKNC